MFPELSFLTNLAILWLYLLDYWWYFLLSVSPQSNQRCWFSYTYVDGWLVEQISGTGHSILLFHRESNSMLSLAPHPLQSIWADLFIYTIPPKICTQIDSQGLFSGLLQGWIECGCGPERAGLSCLSLRPLEVVSTWVLKVEHQEKFQPIFKNAMLAPHIIC